jgi:hypothetical protein
MTEAVPVAGSRTDEEAAGLAQELHQIVENDRYPFSHRLNSFYSYSS